MHPGLACRLAAQYGVVTTREAAACGLDRRDLTRLTVAGRLVRVRTGAYVDGGTWQLATSEQRHGLAAAAVCRSLQGRWAVSYCCAAAMHGLPVICANPDVHLSRLTAGGTRRRSGVVLHTLVDPADVTVHRGVPVVSPAVAVVQTATFGLEAGVVAADAAIRHRLVTASQLRQSLDRARLGSGAGNARRAVDLADGRSESPGESRTRVLCYVLGLPAPEPQAEIFDRSGRLVARVDLLFREQCVVVEFDGLVKYGKATAREALIAEKRREDALRALGYEVVRLTWRDLDDPRRVRELIQAAYTRASRAAARP